MNSQVNTFKCDLFWLHINENHISFGTKELPKDVHLTISYHPNAQHINLHVTRNYQPNPNSHKPKITIVKTDKQEFQRLLPLLTYRLINSILLKIDRKDFTSIKNKICFLNTNKKRNKHYITIQNTFITAFKKSSSLSRKDTRLTITQPMDKLLENITEDKKIQKSYLNMGCQYKRSFNNYKNGIIGIQENSTPFFKINGHWYKAVTPNLIMILTKLVGKEIAKNIISNYNDAIYNIQTCNSLEDCTKFSQPVVLERNIVVN